MFENYGEDALSPNLLFNPMIVCCLFLAISILIALAIMFTAFIGQKVDGVIFWNWASVFAPLFVVDILILILIIAQACTPEPTEVDEETGEKKPKQKKNYLNDFSSVIQFLLFVIWHILIVVKLDKGGLSWTYVWIPIFILEGIILIELIIESVKIGKDDALNTTFKALSIVKTFQYWPFRLLLSIFIVIRADRVVLWDWAIVGIPLYVGVLFYFILDFVFNSIRLRYASPEERAQLQSSNFPKYVFYAIILILLFAFVGMLIVFLNTGLRTLIIVLVPIFLVLSLLLCCCCCLLPCIYCTIMGGNDSPDYDPNDLNLNSTPTRREANLTLPLLEPSPTPELPAKWTIDL